MTTNPPTNDPQNNSDGTLAKKPRSAALTVQAWMESPTMNKSLAAALSGYMDVKKFAAQCYLAAQSPDLAACSAESLFKAFLECAQMGLLPGTHYRHVALVPRKGVIVVTPQWQGFKFLMERQPGIKRVKPVLVHVRDEFRVENGTVIHRFDPFDSERQFEHPDAAKAAKREPGLRGGYLQIEHDTGEVEYHFVSAEKIDRNRRCAETQKLWTQWFEEMATKTVIRDAWSKRAVPVDPEIAARMGHADEADNRALGNDPARVARLLGTGVEEQVPDMTKVPVEAAPTGRAALGLPSGERLPAELAQPTAVPATVE